MSLKAGYAQQVRKLKIDPYRHNNQHGWTTGVFKAAEQIGCTNVLNPNKHHVPLSTEEHEDWQQRLKTTKSNKILLKKEELLQATKAQSSSFSSISEPEKGDDFDTLLVPSDTPRKLSPSQAQEAKQQPQSTQGTSRGQSIDLSHDAAAAQEWENFQKTTLTGQKPAEAATPIPQMRRVAFINQFAIERLGRTRYFYVEGAWEGDDKHLKRITLFQLMEDSLKDYQSTVDSVSRGDCLTLWQNVMALGQPTARAQIQKTLKTMMSHEKHPDEGFQQWLLTFQDCVKQIEAPPSQNRMDEHLKIGLMFSLLSHDKRYAKTLEELEDNDKSYTDSVTKLNAKAINLNDTKNKPQQKGNPTVRSVNVPKGKELKQLKDKHSKEITAKLVKTMCCSAWHEKGTCDKHGDPDNPCAFAHLNKHLPGAANKNKKKPGKGANTDGSEDTKKASTKNQCFNWQKTGSCANGDECGWSHATVNAVRIARATPSKPMEKLAPTFNGVRDEVFPLTNAVDSKTTPIAIGDTVSINETNGKATVRVTHLFAIHRKVPELYIRGEMHLDDGHGLSKSHEAQIRDHLTKGFPCKCVLLIESEAHSAPAAQSGAQDAKPAVNAARTRSNVAVCLDSGSQLNLVENYPGVFVPGSRDGNITTPYGGAAGASGKTDFSGMVTLQFETGAQNVPFHHATTADGVPRLYLSMAWMADNMNAYITLRKSGAWIISDNDAPLDRDGHALDPADKGQVLLRAKRLSGDTCEFPKLWDLPPSIVAAQSKRHRPRVHSIALLPSSASPRVDTREANASTDLASKGGEKTADSTKTLEKLNRSSANSRN